MSDAVAGLCGGAIIGAGASLLLWLDGRVAGISGIVGGLLRGGTDDRAWRAAFVAGLLAGGMLLTAVAPEAFRIEIVRSPAALIVAGLLVGVGTQLGSGCTSGHGVCGISRGSARSLVATLVFMATGAVAVFVVNHLWGAV